MNTFADIATAVSVVGFVAATGYGILAIRRHTAFVETVTYVTIVAAANAAFRMFTSYHRAFDYPLPQPFSTNMALILQIGIAVALLLITGVARMQSKATNGT